MKIIYLSQSRLDFSINAVYIKGLRQNGVEVDPFFIPSLKIKEIAKIWRYYRQHRKNVDFVIVGWDSPVLAIILRTFCRKKIVYNSILSVYERMVISRNLVSPWSLKGRYYWLIDFLAFHFSDFIMLESNNQINFISDLYYISSNRLIRSWIGVNEDNFYYESNIPKTQTFAVVFRGAFMPEAGVEFAIKAAKILENKNIKFIIIGGGLLSEKINELVNKLKPTNLELITDLISYERLRLIMQESHLLLGQLSDHDRLTRTIPMKAYESLAMKLPYLTASNSGILELLTPNKTCLICSPADEKSLAEEILWVKNNYQIAEKIAENGYELYQNELKSVTLVRNLLSRI